MCLGSTDNNILKSLNFVLIETCKLPLQLVIIHVQSCNSNSQFSKHKNNNKLISPSKNVNDNMLAERAGGICKLVCIHQVCSNHSD